MRLNPASLKIEFYGWSGRWIFRKRRLLAKGRCYFKSVACTRPQYLRVVFACNSVPIVRTGVVDYAVLKDENDVPVFAGPVGLTGAGTWMEFPTVNWTKGAVTSTDIKLFNNFKKEQERFNG
jgi:hypothetical protein